MNEYRPTKFERFTARRAAGLCSHDHPPVVVRPGDIAPTIAGCGWHYKTRGGNWIDNPNAYARKGWSNMIYCPSTRRVEVGADWLRERTHNVTITEYEAGVAA